jgi:hypothetical protein
VARHNLNIDFRPEMVNEIVVTLLCKFYNLAGTTRMPTTLR